MASKSAPVKSTSPAPKTAKTQSNLVCPDTKLAKSHASITQGILPTVDDVQNTPGQALSAEELLKLQTTGSLPLGINLTMHPSMHKVKSGQEEYLVIMVDAPPCGCRKVNGKKERCRQHRAQRRHKKKSKKSRKKVDGMVRDDDSDRKKLNALRHAEDSEEEGEQAIDDALTPDKICTVGPAGVAIQVPIDTTDNMNAGPRATNAMKGPLRGILVKGPQDCPQFISEEKIQKNEKGEPKFAKYTWGTLVCNPKGEHVFYPDGGPKFNERGLPVHTQVNGIDTTLQKDIGDKIHVAGVVDVNENGMPVFRQVDVDNPAPQSKLATVGVLCNVDGETVFVQTKGQTVGSGDNAPVIAATRDGLQTPGTVLGEVVYKDGKVMTIPEGQAHGAEVVGTIVHGDYNQPVLIAKKGSRLDNNKTVSYDESKRKGMKEADWKVLVTAQQEQLKKAGAGIEANNVAVAAAMSGKSQEQIRKEMAESKANDVGPQEMLSKSFAQGYHSKSVFCYQPPNGPRGAGLPQSDGAGQFTQNTGDVRSVAFTDGTGGGQRSVFINMPGVAAGGGGKAVVQQLPPAQLGGPASVYQMGNKDSRSVYLGGK